MNTRPSTFSLAFNSLRYYWRANIAVAIGVAIAVMALTGALIVGDSMRFSLQKNATARLGWVDHALIAQRFVGNALTDRLGTAADLGNDTNRTGLLIASGGAVHADTRARSESIQVFGVDRSFWSDGESDWPAEIDRTVVLNQSLAGDLNASVGDDILIRIGTAADLPTETLIGRRDDSTTTLRLPVGDIIPDAGMATLSVFPTQRAPRNAFIPIVTLQNAVDQPSRINAILVGSGTSGDTLTAALDNAITLDDIGLTLRVDEQRGYTALETNRFLIERTIESAAHAAARDIEITTRNVLSYLANSIAIGDRSIPYSIVSAIDFPIANTQPDAAQIILNQWAVDDLKPNAGETITLTYYVTGPLGELKTEKVDFTFAQAVPLADTAADPGLTPTYPGVTDTTSIADWDPPFPISLSDIRPKDDDYWKQHKTTPKAFIALQDGQRLWSEDADRFGQLTSIRIPTTDPPVISQFETALLTHLNPAELGLAFRPVRQQAIQSATGSTDFGQLFIGFSFFVIASAALLVALLFRLGAEQRAKQVGLLLATGYTPRTVLKLLILESALIALVGTIPGVSASQAYASLMLTGLKTWWSAAANAPFLELSLQPTSLAIGGVGGFVVALVATALAVRSLTHLTPRALIAGKVDPPSTAQPSTRRTRLVAFICLGIAVATLPLPATAPDIPAAGIFFGGGSLTLVGLLLLTAARLRRPSTHTLSPTASAILALGYRNTTRAPRRSVSTIALIASATFLIVALQAFQLTTDTDPTDRTGPTGGFTLFANTTIPIAYDLNTDDGRDQLAFTVPEAPQLADTTIIPFRLRDGESSSCLNLYKPTEPRILGATRDMIGRGGFTFSAMIDSVDNPWTLLDRTSDDTIPVIGDEAAVKWQLHSGLGQEIEITNEAGQPVKLRFVALLKGSALQDELIISEDHFVTLFPNIAGYGFFLIDAPPHQADDVATFLEDQLAPHSFDVADTLDRIRQYQQVQNTYLSTFQSLGSFGLILGSLGLGAVLARNIVERRAELALLAAVGYTRKHLATALAAENVLLVIAGLVIGIIPAALAVAPHVVDNPADLPWSTILGTLIAVFVIANVAGLFALATLLRQPLIPSLRSE